MPDRNTAINSTPFSEDELDHFRELLIKEREETKEEINELRESIEGVNENRDDVSSSQDHHPGDLGTDEERKETNYTLIDRNLDKLKEISAALDRIEDKTYGVCMDTGKVIQKERLEAIPYTRYSIGAKEKYDAARPGAIGKPRS